MKRNYLLMQISVLSRMDNERRKIRQAFYNTKRWRDTRDYMKKTHPLCEDCLKEGRITPMEEVHHIKSPFVRGISALEKETRGYSEDNLVCLCKNCHILRHHPEGIEMSMEEKILKYQ